MSLTIELPAQYGYVFGTVTAIFFVNTYHSLLTGSYRKAAKVPYPICYASAEQAAKDPAAFQFNCAQRAHANFVENLTPIIATLFIAGVKFPVLSASLGAAWAASRVLYARGYTRNGPKGRFIFCEDSALTSRSGATHNLFALALSILSGYTSYSFIKQLW
ncbi:hypothetical protein SEPCBS119000_002308 [Sporothrix epigloea]|uniref:Glutathione S-transferase n=1 Tax=Sporothrix epigloea TaxID=1892477 RepID=A0ABP0DFI6_9PEZI